MTLGIIIQARLSSTRLPGKVLKPLANSTVLGCLITRLKQLKSSTEIIIATTVASSDDKIIDFCEKYNIKYFRGSEQDVLSRYYETAKKYNLTDIARITSDCPLFEINLLDEMISDYKNHPQYDYYSNCIKRTYPRGFDIEIFKFSVLEKAFYEASNQYEREHVTPYIWENKEKLFTIGSKINKKDYSFLRLTLDTPEDYELIQKIYAENVNDITSTNFDFILNLLKEKPEIFEINKKIEQKKVTEVQQ